ncbi:Maf family protein [Anatilimnocola floriformis]|uniref:Maf family protein n=1 Tax=Anatilimnocola floriformis TaxID=2948575 RepID=UPI0020C29B3C|nr:nucleoside triphosphate pyrophosphatase [Anatilimnocola floriformis]
MTTQLILASTSKYRRQLLERLRVPFECVAPNVDERALQAKLPSAEPEQIARELARAKAEEVAARYPSAAVIGSDQVCTCDGQILGKPGTAELAIEQLQFLAGKTHRLITAVCVISGNEIEQLRDVTELKMRPLTQGEIERYVAADQPLDCAGSYKLECLGISLFESITSADHTAITGLPLALVAKVLRDLGWNVP